MKATLTGGSIDSGAFSITVYKERTSLQLSRLPKIEIGRNTEANEAAFIIAYQLGNFTISFSGPNTDRNWN